MSPPPRPLEAWRDLGERITAARPPYAPASAHAVAGVVSSAGSTSGFAVRRRDAEHDAPAMVSGMVDSPYFARRTQSVEGAHVARSPGLRQYRHGSVGAARRASI